MVNASMRFAQPAAFSGRSITQLRVPSRIAFLFSRFAMLRGFRRIRLPIGVATI